MTTTETKLAPVANLRDAKRQQATARGSGVAFATLARSELGVSGPGVAFATLAKRRPAGTAKPATKAAPARAAAAGPAPSKLRWTLDGEKDGKGRAPAHASAGDRHYAITGSDKTWRATMTHKGKTVELASGVSHASAYRAIVKHAAG